MYAYRGYLFTNAPDSLRIIVNFSETPIPPEHDLCSCPSCGGISENETGMTCLRCQDAEHFHNQRGAALWEEA